MVQWGQLAPWGGQKQAGQAWPEQVSRWAGWCRAAAVPGLVSAVLLWGGAGPVYAQAGARCFVVPLPGTSATLGAEAVTAPRVTERCAELRVQAGSVQLVYTGAQGEPLSETVQAGRTPVLAGLARSSEAFDGVQRLLTLGVRDMSATAGGTKQYNALAYTPSAFGAPFGELWVPPEGLRFRFFQPKPPSGQAALVVQEIDLTISAGGNPVFLGRVNLDQEVHMPAQSLAPGQRHAVRLRVQTGNGTLDLRGDFTVLDAARSQEISAALGRLQAAGLRDGAAGAIAHALVFEDDALSFNARQRMLQVKP